MQILKKYQQQIQTKLKIFSFYYWKLFENRLIAINMRILF